MSTGGFGDKAWRWVSYNVDVDIIHIVSWKTEDILYQCNMISLYTIMTSSMSSPSVWTPTLTSSYGEISTHTPHQWLSYTAV